MLFVCMRRGLGIITRKKERLWKEEVRVEKKKKKEIKLIVLLLFCHSLIFLRF